MKEDESATTTAEELRWAEVSHSEGAAGSKGTMLEEEAALGGLPLGDKGDNAA